MRGVHQARSHSPCYSPLGHPPPPPPLHSGAGRLQGATQHLRSLFRVSQDLRGWSGSPWVHAGAGLRGWLGESTLPAQLLCDATGQPRGPAAS